MANAIRRPRRQLTPVDTSEFTEHIEQALTAFSEDVSYAVLMARNAVTIARKRDVWQARRDLRAAEAVARQQCSDHEFDCHATSPCGVGDCKFAADDFALLDVQSAAGTHQRPQQCSTGAYSMEPAINALVHRRARSL